MSHLSVKTKGHEPSESIRIQLLQLCLFSAKVTGGYYNETHGLRACAVSVYARNPICHSQMLNQPPAS